MLWIEELDKLWTFLAGVIATLVVVYGKPLLFRGRLFLPDYKAKMSIWDGDLVANGWIYLKDPFQVPVRITNEGKKPIIPVQFYAILAGEKAPIPVVPINEEEGAILNRPIESLHFADTVIQLGTFSTEENDRLKSIYFEDILGHKWHVSYSELKAARETYKEDYGQRRAEFLERTERVKAEAAGLHHAIGFSGFGIHEGEGTHELVCTAENRTQEAISLSSYRLMGTRDRTFTILDLQDFDPIELPPVGSRDIRVPLRLAQDEWSCISAVYFFDTSEKHHSVSHADLERLKELLGGDEQSDEVEE